jgi:hypothetical protein
VSEFVLYYSAYLEGPEVRRFTVYCEHGDQFDPISRVEDYSSSSSTPLGHHVVSDFEHRIVPLGKIAWILDVSEMKNVHPRGAIPQWVASKYFYHALGRAITYLMIPFVLSYLAYRTLAFHSSISRGFLRHLPAGTRGKSGDQGHLLFCFHNLAAVRRSVFDPKTYPSESHIRNRHRPQGAYEIGPKAAHRSGDQEERFSPDANREASRHRRVRLGTHPRARVKGGATGGW